MPKLPNTAHTSRPWRIHEIAPEFRVEDVWALPTPGGPEDFPRLVRLIASLDPSQSPALVVRALFAVRWQLGRLLGWDEADDGNAAAAAESLCHRVPADLGGTADVAFEALPFTPLYLTDDELAAELANRTMHGVIHVGWVADADADAEGGYRGQMAILVKPNGLLGTAYMAAIKPFRHGIVYPLMMRQLERRWREEQAPTA